MRQITNFLCRLYQEESLYYAKSSQRRSQTVDFLLKSRIITEKKGLKGGKYLVVEKGEDLKMFIEKICPRAFSPTFVPNNPAASNALNNRNTKIGGKLANKCIFLSGKTQVVVGGHTWDVASFGSNAYFALEAKKIKTLQAEKVCWVENRHGAFDDIPRLFPTYYKQRYLFIYGYRSLTQKNLFEKVTANTMRFAPDYDCVGINDYLNCQKIHSHTQLFIPKNYDTIYEIAATKLPAGQQPSKQVKACTEPFVQKVRAQWGKHRKYVEQQAFVQF